MTARFVVSVWVTLVGLLLGIQASAITEEECPTWFPDFRCERSGRFDGFVAPITQPYLFEDPFITTGINAVGIWHDYPDDSPLAGGHAWVVAAQARVALTDRLAFIATKDGYMWSKPGNQAIDNEDGFTNIALGFKYALVNLREKNFILTPRLTIEAPTGSEDVYTGTGDGIAHPGLSAAWRTDKLNIIGDFGVQVPFNRHKQSTSFDYHLHLSYSVCRFFLPVFELNGQHFADSGNGSVKLDVRGAGKISLADLGLTGFEGNDVTNLGNRGVAHNDIVTVAFGARIPVSRHVSLGAAYEFPVTHREDIFNQRVTWTALIEF